MKKNGAFGTLAQFETPGEILRAAEAMKDLGYSRMDAYTPFPVHGLDRALRIPGSKIPWVVLGGALLGFCGGLGMQLWMNAVNYPIRIAGKAFASLPAYVPVTFEITVLFSAFAAVFGMFALNGFPRLFHPVFQHSTFHKATDDKFFLAVEAKDPMYQFSQVKKHLLAAGGTEVEEVAS